MVLTYMVYPNLFLFTPSLVSRPLMKTRNVLTLPNTSGPCPEVRYNRDTPSRRQWGT